MRVVRGTTMVYCCWTAGLALRGGHAPVSRMLSVMKAEDARGALKKLPGMRESSRRSRRERKRTIDLTSSGVPKRRRRRSKTQALDDLVGECSPEERGPKITEILLSPERHMSGEAIVQSLEQLCHLGGFPAVKEGYVARASSLSMTELERASKILSLRRAFDTMAEVGSFVDHPSSVYGPLVAGMLRNGNRSEILPVFDAWIDAISTDNKMTAEEDEQSSPLRIFNEVMVQARKSRSLHALFKALEVMHRAGVEGNDETFETISHAAVRSLDFVLGAVSLDTIPRNDDWMEAVLVGRSNVGKSSLVNMLTNRKSAAFVSKTPGKTQQFNYFLVNSPPPPVVRKKGEHKKIKPPWDPIGTFYLVDVPGLGYAEVPKALQKDWDELLSKYLSEHAPLAVLLHLIDSRVGAVQIDLDMFKMIKEAIDDRKRRGLEPLRYTLVLTKADKRDGRRNLAKTDDPLVDRVRRQLFEVTQDEELAQSTPILVTSSVTRKGRDAVWRHLSYAALPRPPPPPEVAAAPLPEEKRDEEGKSV